MDFRSLGSLFGFGRATTMEDRSSSVATVDGWGQSTGGDVVSDVEGRTWALNVSVTRPQECTSASDKRAQSCGMSEDLGSSRPEPSTYHAKLTLSNNHITKDAACEQAPSRGHRR
mmetsp:Transcript_47712/g.88516  ORF Transcript_47712/g.88516 Transcript_47712/m.88516 type:complete len:115 (+) Transcript_47712:150-494(+)